MAEDRDEKLGRVEERITKYYFYQTTFTIKHRIYIYHFSMEQRSLPPSRQCQRQKFSSNKQQPPSSR